MPHTQLQNPEATGHHVRAHSTVACTLRFLTSAIFPLANSWTYAESFWRSHPWLRHAQSSICTHNPFRRMNLLSSDQTANSLNLICSLPTLYWRHSLPDEELSNTIQVQFKIKSGETWYSSWQNYPILLKFYIWYEVGVKFFYFFSFDYLEVRVQSEIHTFYYANHTFIQVKLKEKENCCMRSAHSLAFALVFGLLWCLWGEGYLAFLVFSHLCL